MRRNVNSKYISANSISVLEHYEGNKNSEYIKPTHDLICQMALMSNYGNSMPQYLSASH